MGEMKVLMVGYHSDPRNSISPVLGRTPPENTSLPFGSTSGSRALPGGSVGAIGDLESLYYHLWLIYASCDPFWRSEVCPQ